MKNRRIAQAILSDIKSRLVTKLSSEYYSNPSNYHDVKHNKVMDALIYKIEHIKLDGMMLQKIDN